MNLTPYTVFDRITGDIAHSGTRQPEHVPTATDTHDVLIGIQLKPNTHSVDPTTRKPVELVVTKLAAWRTSLPAANPSEEAVILEAMKAKLTPAELTAAKNILEQKVRK
jgi:hypothetical protein